MRPNILRPGLALRGMGEGLTAAGTLPDVQTSRVDIESALRAAWPRAVRTAYGLLGSTSDAEDVVQDACLVAYRKSGALRDAASFEAWFLTIVVRRAYAASRKRKRPGPVPPDRGEADLSAIVDVRRALDALAPKIRAAVVLCDILQYTSDEASRLLGIPAATVRNRIFRGRRILAQALIDYVPEKRDAR